MEIKNKSNQEMELKNKEYEELIIKKEEELKKEEEELKKNFIHKKINKQSLLENPQFDKEKQKDFQIILEKILEYSPKEYYPNENYLQKRNFILSEPAKKRLSLLNHYISKGINVILEGPTGTSKTLSADIICKSLNKKIIKYNLNAETKINDLLIKYITDSESSTGLNLREGPLLDSFKNGKCCILDEINLTNPSVLHCMEDCLNSKKLIINLPGIQYKEVLMNKNFCLIATQNPNSEEFKNKRNELTQKFLSNFQVIKFDKFSNDEIEFIANGLAKKFGYILEQCSYDKITENNKKKKIVKELSDFHNEWSEKAFNDEENKQIYTIREISATLYALIDKKDKKGENVYDTIMIIYGGRYEKDKKKEIENILKEKYKTIYGCKNENKDYKIPKIFENKFFKNNSLIEVIKSIDFSFRNQRHVILTGKKGNGKTIIAKTYSKYYNNLNEKKKNNNNENDEDNYFVICTPEIKTNDLIGKLKTEKDKIAEWDEGIMFKAIKNGKCIVLDRINEAPSNVAERFNPLYDKTYDNEESYFEINENLQNNKIKIHSNFRTICTCDIENVKDMTPAFLNRFDIIVLENQIVDCSKEEIKELITILLKFH